MDAPSSVTQPIRGHTDTADGSEADSAPQSGVHLFDQALALAQVKTTDHRAAYEGQVHPAFKNINDPYGAGALRYWPGQFLMPVIPNWNWFR